MKEEIEAALIAFCKEHGVVIYANDSSHLVTVETDEGVELFSFGSANHVVLEGLTE